MIEHLINVEKNLFHKETFDKVCNRFKEAAWDVGDMNAYFYASAKKKSADSYTNPQSLWEACSHYLTLYNLNKNNEIGALAISKGACISAAINNSHVFTTTNTNNSIFHQFFEENELQEWSADEIPKRLFYKSLSIVFDKKISSHNLLSELEGNIPQIKIPESLAFPIAGLANEHKDCNDLDFGYELYSSVINKLDPTWLTVLIYAANNRFLKAELSGEKTDHENGMFHIDELRNKTLDQEKTTGAFSDIPTELQQLVHQAKSTSSKVLHEYATSKLSTANKERLTEGVHCHAMDTWDKHLAQSSA